MSEEDYLIFPGEAIFYGPTGYLARHDVPRIGIEDEELSEKEVEEGIFVTFDNASNDASVRSSRDHRDDEESHSLREDSLYQTAAQLSAQV